MGGPPKVRSSYYDDGNVLITLRVMTLMRAISSKEIDPDGNCMA
jgi:hypothetical protein